MNKSYSAIFKREVALAALKEELTLGELASKYKVSVGCISSWKKEALSHLATAFSKKSKQESSSEKYSNDDLFKEIGQLKVENEFLKKKYNQIYK